MIIRLSCCNFLAFKLIILIGLVSAVPSAQSDQEWQKLVDKAGLAYEKGDPKKALDLLKNAVQLTDPGTEPRGYS